MEIPVPMNINPAKPTAGEIANNLKASNGQDPMGFLADILSQPVSNTPAEVLKEVDAKRAAEHQEESKNDPVAEAENSFVSNAGGSVRTPDDIRSSRPDPVHADPSGDGDVQAPAQDAEPAVEEETPHEDSLVQDVLEEVAGSKEVNFKKVRKEFHETKQTLKQKEEELAAVQEKLKQYETGENFPELIKEKDKKIAELSKYEKVVALKVSDAYKEKFVKPIQTAKNKLKEIAEGYGIAPEHIQEALSLKSVKELNSFLSENFDPVGALEVKQLISSIKDTEKAAVAAEQEPQESLQSIEQEYEEVRQQQRRQEIEKISKSAKSVWVETLSEVRKEGKIRELIPSDIDDEHNEKVVSPIVEKAGQQYGAMVRALADAGMTNPPKELLKAIAKMVPLSIASSFAIEARERALEEAEAIKANAVRTHKYIRPNVGGGLPGSGRTEAPGPKNPVQAADMAIAAAMGKK